MSAEPATGTSTVAEPAVVRVGSWLVGPLLGAAVLFVVKLVSDWVAGLSWAPFQGVFVLVADIPEPWGLTASLAVGAVIGLGFAGLWSQERISAEVAPDRLVLARDRTERTFRRGEVGAVFVEGKELVLLDESGAELVRQRTGLDRRELAAALRRHGFPWHGGDPHRARYRPWEPDEPELGLRINALFAERARALRRRDRKEAARLRAELAERGVVVRDERKQQRWRWAELG
ncbi:YqeB family protein [Saccharopolyspora cebuensis]|uniref:DUF308 domain-containing protein n=1 Tax=Saccharopolyspora cebuensis TaxID=418759 RepID=A0ABV4CQ98_9PSEU